MIKMKFSDEDLKLAEQIAAHYRSIIELIGDNLYVAVDYDFKNDSTEFFVYDSDKENVINHLSVPDCSFSFIPEVYPGEGFGIASGFTSQDVTGYFYSISENDYSEFKFDIDKKWNYWGNIKKC